MHRHVPILAFTALFALATCSKTNNDVGSVGQTCTYNGKTYPYATTWPSTDGCHECWCQGPDGVCEAGPSCDGGVQSGPSCTYDGKSYTAGATFPSTDGCNSCECLWKWTPGVACTLKDCSGSSVVDALAPIDATADACVYYGTTYPLDAHFQAADGCNDCHCRADGQVTCTLRQDCQSDAGAQGGGGTSDGGVCTWPAGFTPSGDDNAVGCWATAVPGPVDASQMTCSSAEYGLHCVGDIQRFDSGCQMRTMPAPDSSLGCRVLPLPTAFNNDYYCCPCGQSQPSLADASITFSSGCP